MSPARRLRRCVAATVLAAWLVPASGCTTAQGTGDTGYVSGDGRVTQVAPADRDGSVELTGEDLAGKPLSLADFRGRPAVVVVWGSWCGECRAEADDLVSAARELGDEAGFVGINTRDPSPANAQSYVRRFAVPYPSFYSPGGEALLAFSGTLTPRTIPGFAVLDAEGRIAASIVGRLPSRTTLVELVREVAAEGRAAEDRAAEDRADA